jgi:hypothetical protein
MSKQTGGGVRAVITRDGRRVNGWVHGKASGGITCSAKIFDVDSDYGIDKGRVSKLDIRANGKTIVNYDRGWDVRPQTAEHNAVFNAVTAALNELGKETNIGARGDFLGELESNKAKVSRSRAFSVVITETLKMTAEVEAASREEAEQMVSDNWRNADYILDAENFAGVEFEATPAKRDKSRGTELC